MSNTIFAGIDVSTKSNKVCILNASGDRLDKFSTHNSPKGVTQIVDHVMNALVKSNTSNVHFSLEATL